ncbi:hypothetical protein EDC04DRAFT_2606487 [Pisolithus marmoratus]|nr:hypothetical protein EDC04DRAFT_2606487 [Pisolithus marmoratus]
MPHAAKATDTPMVNSTDLHMRVLRNRKILTPQHPSNPGDAGVTCPDGQSNHLKGGKNTCLATGTEEGRLCLDHIPEEDAEMDIPKKSSDGEEEGDEGKDHDSESDGNDFEDDGPATESLLPLSSPPPPLPSDSSDTEDDLPQLCQPRQTNNKGKGRAIDVEDTNVAGSNSDTPPRSKKPGTLSHAALDDIREFSSKVKKEAEELGRCYSRSTHDILVAARFGVKPSHTKLNEANLFRSWYWVMQLKPDGAKRDAINNIIMQEYNSLIKDIPKDDTAVRREKLKHVYEWSENSSIAPTNKSVKSIATRVQNAKTQFSGLAEAWSNLEEIEIVGVVMCLRDGSSSEAGLLGRSSTAGSDSSWELHCCIWEIPRDRNCRVFGSMIKEKLVAALKDLHVGNHQKIVWQCLLEFMTKNYLIILNWPIGVSLPGPGFEYKKLKANPLCKLVVPYLRQKLGTMYDGQSDDDEEQDSLDGVPEIEIRPWSQDIISMSESHHLKGEIPLVKAADGMVLRKVSDDPSWQKSHEEEDGRQGDPVDPPQQHQLPFPSHKRHHMEVTNDDTTRQEAAHSEHQMMPHDEGRNAHSTVRDRSDLRRDVPNHTNMQDCGSSQPLPRQHEDRWYEHANYNDPGPSNVPYNLMPPIHQNVCRNFPPSHQPYHRIPSHDHHVYHDGPFINDYNPAAQPTQQHWVNRGNTMHYDDDFDGDYLEEDY